MGCASKYVARRPTSLPCAPRHSVSLRVHFDMLGMQADKSAPQGTGELWCMRYRQILGVNEDNLPKPLTPFCMQGYE